MDFVFGTEFTNSVIIAITQRCKGHTVTLYSDFAPLRMEFSITENEKLILYGGFKFHGPHDGLGNGGAPTFSVCIDPDDKPGWRIFT